MIILNIPGSTAVPVNRTFLPTLKHTNTNIIPVLIYSPFTKPGPSFPPLYKQKNTQTPYLSLPIITRHIH